MSEIAATSLGNQFAGDVLALKLRLQQEAAVVDLVGKALESPELSAAAPPAADRLVDIVV